MIDIHAPTFIGSIQRGSTRDSCYREVGITLTDRILNLEFNLIRQRSRQGIEVWSGGRSAVVAGGCATGWDL
jgi:hypothetical protein